LKLSQKENQDESQKKIEIKAAFGEETGKKILSTLRNIKNNGTWPDQDAQKKKFASRSSLATSCLEHVTHTEKDALGTQGPICQEIYRKEMPQS